MPKNENAPKNPALKPVRGTHDILPADYRRHRMVVETARRVAAQYGYGEMSMPIFEFTEVFQRTLGDTSDIVSKEMYTFADRSGDSLTLRPEATAGVARAFLSNGLIQELPLKVFCQGPMFRYERPQKGRLRQFHQIDVELLGVAEALGDVEIIALGADVLNALGLKDKVTLELNTLGDLESRLAYRSTLVDYLSGHATKLSSDSRARLERNPLRILDSKNEGDRAIIADAPLISDSLNFSSRRIFEDLCAGLTTAGISYRLNPRLVRGLDYYCHAAFEFTTEALGAQGTVLAGGRYDGLIAQMGGQPTPGTGWAAGVERLAMLIEAPPEAPRPIAVVPVGEDQDAQALAITLRLRRAGFTVELGYSGKVKKRMKRANKLNACAAVVLGSEEAARQAVMVRNMDTGEEAEVSLESLEAHLACHR
ncbi:MAG: histidine--tRNA ligase [Rhodospirillales bacterium]|jgi:histidyl-tRNA synthetase|nr:histidine--tRNA ligase [Rhodospirillales bacterium]